MNKCTGLFAALFLLGAATTIHAMETNTPNNSFAGQLSSTIERGAVDPITQLKIWARAVQAFNKDLAQATWSGIPADEQLRKFTIRKDALIATLNRLNQQHPELFVGCEHLMPAATAIRTEPSSPQTTPQTLDDNQKLLAAIQAQLAPTLQDPNVSPAVKKAAIILGLIQGAAITLVTVAYYIVRMIRE